MKHEKYFKVSWGAEFGAHLIEAEDVQEGLICDLSGLGPLAFTKSIKVEEVSAPCNHLKEEAWLQQDKNILSIAKSKH